MTRPKKLIVAAGVTVAIVGGGAAIAAAQSDPGPPDLDRAAQAGRVAAGDGDVTAVEQDDDGTYEVEIRRADGTETDIDLSPTFEVTRTEVDGDGGAGDDDRALDDATRARAADAALASVGDGTVASVEGDDGGYEVEIRHADGIESEVSLDAHLVVQHIERDSD